MNLHENASRRIIKTNKQTNIKPLEKKEQNGREVKKRLQQNFSTWNAGDWLTDPATQRKPQTKVLGGGAVLRSPEQINPR